MNESVRESVERFDPATMHELIAAEHLARYWLAAGLASGLVVLDAGCGVGYGAEMIARAGASRVVGIDLAPDAIATASERAGEGGAEFQVGDVRDPPFEEGAFDLVVCFEVLEHLEDPEPAITALKRVLREGGLLLASSPNRGVYPPGNPHHLHEFTVEELRDALAARFANVVMMRQHPWLASLIDNGTLGLPGEEPVRASIAREGKPVDAWMYAVALASDGAIHQPAAINVLAESDALVSLVRSAKAATKVQRKLGEDLAAVNEARRRLGETLSAANEDRARLRDARNAAVMEKDQLQRELHQLVRSRSWRVTRPLRAAGAVFRRLSQARTAARKR